MICSIDFQMAEEPPGSTRQAVGFTMDRDRLVMATPRSRPSANDVHLPA